MDKMTRTKKLKTEIRVKDMIIIELLKLLVINKIKIPETIMENIIILYPKIGEIK